MTVPVGFLVFCIIAGVTSGSGKAAPTAASPSSAVVSSQATSKTATTSKAAVSSAASSVKVDKTLESGFYTVGVDIPAGTYNFKAVSGGGNVSTSDVSVNEIMGTADKGSNYQATFNNAKLSNGIVLDIAGVSVEVTCDNASGAALKPRNQSITGVKQFAAGNYTAGKDFTAGTYDLVVVSGGGNVSTADGKLNAIMGTDSDDSYLKNYHNVEFKDGAVLNISGVTISLTPSK